MANTRFTGGVSNMWYVTYYGSSYENGLGVLATFDPEIVEKFLDDRMVIGFDSTKRSETQDLIVRGYPDDWSFYRVIWEERR